MSSSGAGGAGGGEGCNPPAANGPAACANCLHPADRHTVRGVAGRGCDVEIAVSYSDGPDTCPCERCIAAGSTCSVGGCGEAAARYRMDASMQIARDMCQRHYDEAEPYCDLYYELTGSRRPGTDGERCAVDGCGGEAIHYVLGRDHARHDLCAVHFVDYPYGKRYYEMTGGRPFPEGTPCDVDGCGSEAVQYVGAAGGAAGGGGRGLRRVCAEHYAEAAPALVPAAAGGSGS